MVWIWSKTKLEAFIKKIALIELRRYFKYIQKKILEQVKEIVADECRLQMNARMEAAITSAIKERHDTINSQLAPLFEAILAKVDGLKEVDDILFSKIVEAIDEMAKRTAALPTMEDVVRRLEVTVPRDLRMLDERISVIETVMEPAEAEPVPGSVLHNLATMGDILAMTPEQREDIKARLEEIQTMRGVACESFPPAPPGSDASDSALVRRIARRALGLEG